MRQLDNLPPRGFTGQRYIALTVLLAVWCLPLAARAQTFYSPAVNLEKNDVAAIESARKSIDLAAYSLTDQAVTAALADRAKAGIKVRIYLDRGELQAECRGDAACSRIPAGELAALPGIEVRVKRELILMHLKSYAVDNSLLRDGSANFSRQGESRQDNSATFSTDRKAVAAFESKFEAMWNRPDNLTVAQAVAGTGK